MTTGKAEMPFLYDAERTAGVYGNITSWDKPKCLGSTGQHANVHNGAVINRSVYLWNIQIVTRKHIFQKS